METKGRIVFKRIGDDYVQVTESEWIGLSGGFHWVYLWDGLIVCFLIPFGVWLLSLICKVLVG